MREAPGREGTVRGPRGARDHGVLRMGFTSHRHLRGRRLRTHGARNTWGPGGRPTPRGREGGLPAPLQRPDCLGGPSPALFFLPRLREALIKVHGSSKSCRKLASSEPRAASPVSRGRAGRPAFETRPGTRARTSPGPGAPRLWSPRPLAPNPQPPGPRLRHGRTHRAACGCCVEGAPGLRGSWQPRPLLPSDWSGRGLEPRFWPMSNERESEGLGREISRPGCAVTSAGSVSPDLLALLAALCAGVILRGAFQPYVTSYPLSTATEIELFPQDSDTNMHPKGDVSGQQPHIPSLLEARAASGRHSG